MSRSRHTLVFALALLAPALAGCATPQDVDPASAEAPVLVTSPDDYSYLENVSTADAPHLHDYWGGKETLVLLDEARPEGTFFFSDKWSTVFRPAAGAVVPQGASEVEVTVSWTAAPHSQFSDPELWVKTAADKDAWRVGALEQGVPLVIESTNERNDLPHQGLSAWEFEFRLHPNAANHIWYEGEVHVIARAMRGLDIPLYPAHPDAWKGADEIPLFQEGRGFFIYEGDSNGGYNCYGGCPVAHVPEDGDIVPTDASVVEVRLTTGEGSLTQLGLSVHGAESRDFTRHQPASVEGDTRVYLIPVERGMGDGPYAKQSQWVFLPYIEGPVEDGWHAGSYHITAKALKQG